LTEWARDLRSQKTIESAQLREQLAAAKDMLMETATDAGHVHARIEAMKTERDA
jgi:hypothetical protein